MFCQIIIQYFYLVTFTWWFLVSWCCYVIFRSKTRPISYFYWVSVHFGSHYNYIVLNSGTLVRKIKCRSVEHYYSLHTSFPIDDFTSETFLFLQRLSKYYKKNIIKKHFFLTQGKTNGGKQKHKRSEALSVIILAKMFHFP